MDRLRSALSGYFDSNSVSKLSGPETPSTTAGSMSPQNSDTFQPEKSKTASRLKFNMETNIVRPMFGRDSDQVLGQQVGKPIAENNSEPSKYGYRVLANNAVYVGHFSNGKPDTASQIGNIARMLPSFLGGKALGDLADSASNTVTGTPVSRILYPDECSASVRFEQGVPKHGIIKDPKSNNSWNGGIDENGMPLGKGTFTYRDLGGNLQAKDFTIKSKIDRMWPAEALEDMRAQLVS